MPKSVGLADLIIKVTESSVSTISYSSTVITISSSSLNHLTVGFGFPANLTVNLASWPSFTVTFSSLPITLGISIIIENKINEIYC